MRVSSLITAIVVVYSYPWNKFMLIVIFPPRCTSNFCVYSAADSIKFLPWRSPNLITDREMFPWQSQPSFCASSERASCVGVLMFASLNEKHKSFSFYPRAEKEISLMTFSSPFHVFAGATISRATRRAAKGITTTINTTITWTILLRQLQF